MHQYDKLCTSLGKSYPYSKNWCFERNESRIKGDVYVVHREFTEVKSAIKLQNQNRIL